MDTAASGKVRAMALSGMLARIVEFLRGGYPRGVPAVDYVPLFALLRRRLSDEEVAKVSAELAVRGDEPIAAADLGVAITKITDELPSPTDTERIRRRVIAAGRLVDDTLRRGN